MKNNILSGEQVLARLIAADTKSINNGGAGILTTEQRNAARVGALIAEYDEKYHRAYIANTGSGDAQILMYEINYDKESGVTNLEKGVKLADDYVMVETRARVATIPVPNTTPGVTDLRSTAKLKVAEFVNLLQAPGANQTLAVPSEITAAEFQLNIDSNKQFSFGFKNYFQYNNRKDEIEGAASGIPVPNGLILVKKGKALKPTLVLPNGVTLPNTAAGANAVAYATEFVTGGYTLRVIA
jgi:hypothetical protein